MLSTLGAESGIEPAEHCLTLPKPQVVSMLSTIHRAFIGSFNLAYERRLSVKGCLGLHMNLYMNPALAHCPVLYVPPWQNPFGLGLSEPALISYFDSSKILVIGPYENRTSPLKAFPNSVFNCGP